MSPDYWGNNFVGDPISSTTTAGQYKINGWIYYKPKGDEQGQCRVSLTTKASVCDPVTSDETIFTMPKAKR